MKNRAEFFSLGQDVRKCGCDDDDDDDDDVSEVAEFRDRRRKIELSCNTVWNGA